MRAAGLCDIDHSDLVLRTGDPDGVYEKSGVVVLVGKDVLNARP